MPMRAWKTTLSVVLAAFLAMGAAEASYAVPSVVDQYTEQVPGPGGDVPNDPPPNNVPKSTPPPSGNGSNATDTSGVVNVAPETGATQPNAGGSSVDGHKKARHAHESEKQNRSEHQADRDQSQIKLGSIGPASGADRGDGMGWLFPAALLAMAAVMVSGIVARRRREGGGSA